jgi:hypothetical protein
MSRDSCDAWQSSRLILFFGDALNRRKLWVFAFGQENFIFLTFFPLPIWESLASWPPPAERGTLSRPSERA